MKKKDPTSHRIIEKRRRDRMNNCLADLSKLIPNHYLKKGHGRVEKTEIIEMAIKHLKDLNGGVCPTGFDVRASLKRQPGQECSSPVHMDERVDQMESGRVGRIRGELSEQRFDQQHQQTASVDLSMAKMGRGQPGPSYDLAAGTPMDCSAPARPRASSRPHPDELSSSLYGRASSCAVAGTSAGPACAHSNSRGQEMGPRSDSSTSSSSSTRAFHSQQYQNNERHINHRASEHSSNKYRMTNSSSSSSSSGSDSPGSSSSSSSGSTSTSGCRMSSSGSACTGTPTGCCALRDANQELEGASSNATNNKTGQQQQQQAECCPCGAVRSSARASQQRQAQTSESSGRSSGSADSGSSGPNNSSSDQSDSGSVDFSSGSDNNQERTHTPPLEPTVGAAASTTTATVAPPGGGHSKYRKPGPTRLTAGPGSHNNHNHHSHSHSHHRPSTSEQKAPGPCPASPSSPPQSGSTSSSSGSSGSSGSSPAGWCKKAWLMRSFARSLSQN